MNKIHEIGSILKEAMGIFTKTIEVDYRIREVTTFIVTEVCFFK